MPVLAALRLRPTAPLAILASALLAACSSDRGTVAPAPPPPPPAVAAIRILPSDVRLEPGASVQFRAEALDAAGRVLDGRTITWQSTAPTVATVTATGEVTAVAEGAAGIVATSGTISQTARAIVARQAPVVAVVEPSERVVLLDPAQSRRLTAVARDARGVILADRAVRWSSSDVAVARVDGSGLVTAVAPGQAVLTAAVDGVHAEVAVRVQAAVQSWQLAPLPATTPRDEWRVLTRVRHTPPGEPPYTEYRVLERARLEVSGARWSQEMTLAIWHDVETPFGDITHVLVRHEELRDGGRVAYDFLNGDFLLDSEGVPGRRLRGSVTPAGLLVTQPVAVGTGERRDLYRR